MSAKDARETVAFTPLSESQLAQIAAFGTERPMTAGELAKTLPIRRSAVVQHLKLLEAAALVEPARDGRRRVYRVRCEGLEPLALWMRQQTTACSAVVRSPRQVTRFGRRRIAGRRSDTVR